MTEKRVSVRLQVAAENVDEVRRKLEGLDVDIKKVGSTNLDAVRRQFEALEGRVDPLARATQRLARDNETLNKVLAAEPALVERVNRIRQQRQTQFEQERRALEAAARTGTAFNAVNDNLVRGLGRTHQQMQVMNAAAVNTFQSLASGAPVMQTLVTQGAQMAGAFGSVSMAMLGVVGASAAAAGGIALLARAALEAGDRMTQAEGRLRAATGSLAAARDVYGQLYELSQQTGMAVADSAGQFVRFRIAGNAVGATNEEVVRLVETVQKFGIVSGASTSEAQAGAVQLAQALASGRLQGDELRSVLENMPLLAQEIADELGVPIGKLREMGEAGELSAERIFRAILDAKEKADEQFGLMPVTVERASNIMGAAWERFTAEIDRSLGLSEKLAAVLMGAANAINSMTAAIEAAPANVLKTLQQQRAEILAMPEMRTDPQTGRPANPLVYEQRMRQVAELDRAIEQTGELARAEQMLTAHRQLRERATAAAAKAEAERARVLTDYQRAVKGLHPQEVALAKLEETKAAITAALKADLIDQAQATKDIAAAEDAYQQALEKGKPKVDEATKARKKLVDEILRGVEAADKAGESDWTRRMEEGRRVLESVRSPAEKYAEEVERLRGLLTDGAIDQDTFNRAVQQADPAFQQAQQAARQFQQDVENTSKNIADDLAEKMFEKGGDILDWWRNLLKRMAIEIASTQFIMPIVQQVVGAVPGLFGIQSPAGAVASQQAGGGSGLGSINTPFGLGMSNSGMGPSSMWSHGTFFGDAVNWLNTPIAGGPSTALMSGIDDVGQLGYAPGTPAGGITPGNILGAAGYGINSIMNFKNGNPIAGVGNAAATAMMFIPGAQPFAPFVAIGSQILGGIFGGLFDKGPPAAAAGNVTGPDGYVRSDSDTDNDGDPEAAAQMEQALNTAAETLRLVSGAKYVGEVYQGIEFKSDKWKPRIGDDEEFLGKFDTFDEAQIAAFKEMVNRGLIEVGDDVAVALKNTTATTLDDFSKDLDLARRLDEASTALDELDTSLTGVEKAAKKATAAGYETAIEEVERADKLGLGDEYRRVAEAQIRSMLDPVTTEFTAVQQTLATVAGQAAATKEAIDTMNLAISDTEVDAWQAAQVTKLQDASSADRDTLLNTLRGESWRNSVQGFADWYEDQQTDIAALWGDGEQAQVELGKAAEIVRLQFLQLAEDGEITAEGLADLKEQFPEFTAAIDGAAAALSDAEEAARISAARTAAEADLETAFASALQGLIGETEQLADGFGTAATSLSGFRRGLLISSSTSPYGAEQRRAMAVEEVYRLAALTRSGDPDEALRAMQDLQPAIQAALEASRDVNTLLGPGYALDVETMVGILDSTETLAERQERTQRDQLSELRRIAGVNESGFTDLEQAFRDVLSKGDFRDYGSGSQGALNRLIAAAVPEYEGGFGPGEFEAWALQQHGAVGANPGLNAMLIALGADPNGFGGKGTWGNPFRQMDASDPQRAAADYLLKMFGFPGFADGGFHSGGLRLVGERGVELEATGPSRIWSAEQTAEMLAGVGRAPPVTAVPAAGDWSDAVTRDLLAENRRLRDEVRALNARMQSLLNVAIAAGDQSRTDLRRLERALERQRDRERAA
ncbi:tape measure protein [Azospirillum sp. ST 5-10]|uniref:tape measure protein n=1 Tax=unclassified Azospirillum TaxID=2630922 RepID=UPI003F4A7CDE